MKQDELIHGLHAVRAALRYEPSGVLEVWMERNRRDQKMARLREELERSGARIQDVPRKELDRLSDGAAHQGVVIRYRGPEPRGQDALEAHLAGLDHAPFLLILDQVQDPHNLGACLRTADAAGVDAVVAPRDKAVGLTATVHKVASGATASVPFFQVTNLARCLETLKQQGIWLVGAAEQAEAAPWELDLAGPLAVVMGAEGAGLRRLTRESCDFLTRIPMAGQVASLNVSVATGVLLFEAVRQRLSDASSGLESGGEGGAGA
ncbi:23S rRNA (guanosine(2251)-2'-O)-methyltransferase RlmB [Aquisalimonas sp. 2447]|uniref:23S rRNA (guanosine(2251)-2'-O)-methyltransferase RlmB n=1 Tax=Aquisalimonas sp. 2447 TaxID=2740807 RepID=UPI00143230D7|nr:23S rRNA (guanosine(2251)-2'-O)-methyltransferase RlmB [Aquisalimonas sp. 2447]QIT56009.1 23S rRNA (guanosine(2251)-2'-O)-methyltransferase RlmB [Aquisalimonas sp. 2447]